MKHEAEDVAIDFWLSCLVCNRCVVCCRMTITVSNKLGGQKIGDSTYTFGGVSYGFRAQTFTSDVGIKRARFQFDFERPTHCLLENDVADVIDRSANCTVFPIALDEDITSVSFHISYTGGPKNGTLFVCRIASSNINRFLNLFHCRNQEKSCNNITTKDPTTPQVCCYSTL